MKALYLSEHIIIRQLSETDISPLCQATGDQSEETMRYYAEQMAHQRDGECIALLAIYNSMLAGFAFLYYRCKWGGMGGKGIPGIVDLFVLPDFRNKGIASKLMDVAESIAAEYHHSVYLDVCLDSSHGAAQRLYIERGYVPDGKGVYYKEQICPIGAPCKNDDELTLCLVKQLKNPTE